jgi:drug/metabolite transporter (DMT)-like permease
VLLSGIASGMLYALYTIFGRYALARYSTYTVTVYTFILAFLASIFFGDAPGLIRALRADPSLILWILGLAVISTVFPYFLYTWGLQHMESGKAAILVAVEPVVGAIIGMTVFREPHDLYKLIGIALIIAAIFVLNTGGKSPDPEKT